MAVVLPEELKSAIDSSRADGFPMLWASVDELAPIKKLAKLHYDPALSVAADATRVSGLVTGLPPTPGAFRAVSVEAMVQGGKITFSDLAAGALSLKPGQSVEFMPYY